MFMRLFLRASLVLISSLVIASYCYISFRQISDSRASDPVESVLVGHARTLAQHPPEYVEPATLGEPSIMPGFPFVVSSLTGVPAPGPGHARSIALGATLCVFLLVLIIVHMECASWTLALASGSSVLTGILVLSELPAAARPDSLMVLLVLLGFLLLRLSHGLRGALLGAFPLAAAFFVDQQAVWFIA